MDEPTIGLDASVKETIRSFIRYMNETYQTTFLITSHDMKDIESLCERIFIIDKGKKVYDGSLTRLKERFSTIKTILFSTEKAIEKDLQLEGWEFERKDDFHFEIHYQSQLWTSAQVIEQVFQHFTVEDVTMKELEIESMVRQIYEEGIHA